MTKLYIILLFIFFFPSESLSKCKLPSIEQKFSNNKDLIIKGFPYEAKSYFAEGGKEDINYIVYKFRVLKSWKGADNKETISLCGIKSEDNQYRFLMDRIYVLSAIENKKMPEWQRQKFYCKESDYVTVNCEYALEGYDLYESGIDSFLDKAF